VSYSYAIERAAAQVVFQLPVRERRLIQSVFEQIARAPFHGVDLEETGMGGRRLLTRFVGPFSVTYWLDEAVPEVRIAAVFRG
jgi:hypothetical protein